MFAPLSIFINNHTDYFVLFNLLQFLIVQCQLIVSQMVSALLGGNYHALCFSSVDYHSIVLAPGSYGIQVGLKTLLYFVNVVTTRVQS